jgi:hypothetical protein
MGTIIITLLAVSLPALAQEAPQQELADEEIGLIEDSLTTLRQVELCDDLQNFAEPLLYARELGIPLEALIPDYFLEDLNEESRLVVTEIFEILYDRPFPEHEMELAARWIRLGCLRGLY